MKIHLHFHQLVRLVTVFHFLIPIVSQAIIGGNEVSNQVKAPENSIVALQLNYTDEQGVRSFEKASGAIIDWETVHSHCRP